MFLEILQNSQENSCVRVSFLIKLQTLGLELYESKETPTQVFFCEICEVFKNTFFEERLRRSASVKSPKFEENWLTLETRNLGKVPL